MPISAQNCEFRKGDKVEAWGLTGEVTLVSPEIDLVAVSLESTEGTKMCTFKCDGRQQSWHKESTLRRISE